MRQVMLTALLALLCAAFSARVWSQDIPRTYDNTSAADTLFRRNLFSVLFDRNLTTYNWLSRLLIDTAAAGGRIGLNGLYGSNIILTNPGASDTRRLRSDQVSLTTLLSRPIADDVSAQAQWSSLVSTDNRGVGLSNASSHSILGGVSTQPYLWLTAAPMIGYRWDDQAGVRDHGPSMQLTGTIHDLYPEGYQLGGSFQFHRDRLDPRTLESHFVRGGVEKEFTRGTRDSLEVGFTRTRREFYALADSTLESRVDVIMSFANLLAYDAGGGFLTNFFVSVAGRTLDKNIGTFGGASARQPLFNSEITEFHLDTYVQISYRDLSGKTSGFVRLSHSERDELHTLLPSGDDRVSVQTLWSSQNQEEKTKDNLAKRTAISGALTMPLSGSDDLSFTGWASILRYDTPSLLNVEDRDELLVAASIFTTHRISRSLDLAVSLDGTLSHLVYLLSDRSANNNINRVLRLAPRVICRPFGALTTVNGFEVLANYTVYDFEGGLAPVKSFSYRQFGWIDTTTVPIDDRIGLDFFVYLKLYERGQLNWTDFRERRENSTVDQSFATQVRFNPEAHTVFAVGLRYFGQLHYSYTPEGRKLDSFLSNIGPTCLIQHQIGFHGFVSFQGWYERRKQPDGTTQMLGSMTLNLSIIL